MTDPYDIEKIREMEVFAGFGSFRSIQIKEVDAGIPSHNINEAHEAVCNGPVLYIINQPKVVLDRCGLMTRLRAS